MTTEQLFNASSASCMNCTQLRSCCNSTAQVSQLITSRRYFRRIIIHSICHACYMSCTSHRPVRCIIPVPVTTTAVFPASRTNYCYRHPLLNQRLPHRVSLDKMVSCTNKQTDRQTDMYLLDMSRNEQTAAQEIYCSMAILHEP